MGGMNERQRAFVREYLADFNATQAAIRAGYSKTSAYSQASDLLRKPEIQRALAQARDAADSEAIMQFEEACSRLTDIARTECDSRIVISAIERLGKFSGWDAPAKTQEVGNFTILVPDDWPISEAETDAAIKRARELASGDDSK